MVSAAIYSIRGYFMAGDSFNLWTVVIVVHCTESLVTIRGGQGDVDEHTCPLCTVENVKRTVVLHCKKVIYSTAL